MAQIDVRFYDGKDVCSGGEIEDDILHIVKNTTDIDAVIARDNRWPILYHLSPVRRNLLEWFNFDSNASLLEIGGGCGAITGLFCEKVKQVNTVELSKRRAEIIKCRNCNADNLTITVGNLYDIRFEEQFDYITLIGVLEYAGKFTDGDSPYRSFLEAAGKLLKDDGTLIIAIENRYGLKYWAGAKEDHTGKLFDGITGYQANPGVRTFGKHELSNLLESAGFLQQDFYYPMPDYKLPKHIYSDLRLPASGETLEVHAPNYDRDRMVLFDEHLVINGLLENKLFDVFANSFLVICKRGSP